MAVKPGSKYFPLHQFLKQRVPDSVELSFDQVEDIMQASLPDSAWRSRSFWSNRARGGHQAAAWLQAGYEVTRVDLQAGRVVFERPHVEYRVRRRAGRIEWDGQAVRALRDHLDASQAELADILGVRQQTISEWENQVYRPTRGRSKHLTLIAERAGFPLEEAEEGHPVRGD